MKILKQPDLNFQEVLWKESNKARKTHGRNYKLLKGRISDYKGTGQPISADWTISTPKI
jgi:hypothetical protein